MCRWCAGRARGASGSSPILFRVAAERRELSRRPRDLYPTAAFETNCADDEIGRKRMSRNLLYPVLGVLLIAAGAFGYWAYQEQNRNAVELNVGGRSITVETR
jgi:hypothetical protein